jgi:hypothetical protein
MERLGNRDIDGRPEAERRGASESNLWSEKTVEMRKKAGDVSTSLDMTNEA